MFPSNIPIICTNQGDYEVLSYATQLTVKMHLLRDVEITDTTEAAQKILHTVLFQAALTGV